MLIERLLEALGQAGSICVYSPYERRTLRHLAAAFPQKADALAAVQARLFDLLPVVREHCYHPQFHGSFSLKNVLPALVPGLGYDDMAVADGREAAAFYQRNAPSPTTTWPSANTPSRRYAPTATATRWPPWSCARR